MRTKLWIAALILILAPTAALGQGLLIPTDRTLKPLTIQYHRVQIEIDQQTAVTSIVQGFANHTGGILEATYVFPVPKGSTVADFEMIVNGKKVRGEILERDRARRIYQDIVRRLRDPGLLEYMGENLFQARVFPIQPRSTQEIAITLHQVVECDNGVCGYTYPMNSGTRAGQTDEDFTLSARIKSRTAIKSVYSPTHEIAVERADDYSATAGFEIERAALDRDFELVYTLSDKDVGLSLLSSKPKGEDGFFLLLVSPKVEVDADVLPKDITFVIDTSGSMSGEKIEYAKRALLFCLNNLNKKDRFNIVRFSTDVNRFNETLVYAAPDNIKQAGQYVASLRAIGGTNIDGALGTALAVHEDRKGRPHLVVFLTDGKPTVGETNLEAIAKNTAGRNKLGARVFVFGVGNQVNTKLLDRLSLENKGTSRYVKPGQEIEMALSQFYAKVASPVMSDLALDLGGSGSYDIYPGTIPDLFAGDQLVVLGRYKNSGERLVSLTGTFRDKRRTIDNEVSFEKTEDPRHFIEKMWATRKVGYLLEQVRLHGEEKELVDEIVDLSKRYGIVTPYTSYLIVEDREPIMPPPRAGGGPSPLPVEPQVFNGRMDRERGLAGGETRKGAIAPEYDGFAEESGADAVHTSRTLSQMKEKKVLEDVPGALFRYESGRSFVMQNGVWTDAAFEEGFEVLKVRYLSDAYFKLLDLRPELADALALGERVLIVVGERKAVLITDEEVEDIPADKLKRFID